MSTLTEALAHMTQLVDLGCEQNEALENTCQAYELEFDSREMLETMFEESMLGVEYKDYILVDA